MTEESSEEPVTSAELQETACSPIKVDHSLIGSTVTVAGLEALVRPEVRSDASVSGAIVSDLRVRAPPGSVAYVRAPSLVEWWSCVTCLMVWPVSAVLDSCAVVNVAVGLLTVLAAFVCPRGS